MQFFHPKPQNIPVLIVFLDDSEKVFNVHAKQSGLNLLMTVAQTVEVQHYEYFGLKYFNMFKKPQWLQQKKSVRSQLKKNHAGRSYSSELDQQVYRVFFQVRYYPRDPTSIPSENFRYQIFLQIRKDMSLHRLIIKDESDRALLFALIIQSDFGDYQESRFASNYVRQAVLNHVTTLSHKLEESIRHAHAALKGTEPVSAEYQFLEKIRWFESYGSIVYPVKDIYNRNCLLSINPQGFALRFEKDPGYNYEIFWPRISNIRRNSRKLVVKERGNEATQNHIFEVGDKTICIELYKLAQDHFTFFKSKKDEKPLTKDPVKRTIGQRSSREFGYLSDNSEFNQYSDTTLTSFPDSINTTQSTKTPKLAKKSKLHHHQQQRNCISDIEESALSRKHRRVIVSKSQTETEDEIFPHNRHHHHYHQHSVSSTNNKHHHHKDLYNNTQSSEKSLTTSFERLPPDYIYENKRNINSSPELQQRTKRLKKKNPSYANQNAEPRSRQVVANQKSDSDRKYLGMKEMEPYFTTRQPAHEIIRSKSGDSVVTKARIRRKLPKTDVPQYSFEKLPDQYDSEDHPIKSVDQGQALRSSPTKRLLPNLNEIIHDNSNRRNPTDFIDINHNKHSKNPHSNQNRHHHHHSNSPRRHQNKMPLETRLETYENHPIHFYSPAVPKHKNNPMVTTAVSHQSQFPSTVPHSIKIKHQQQHLPITQSISKPLLPAPHNYYAPHINFISNQSAPPNSITTNHKSAFHKHQPISELKRRPEPRSHGNYNLSETGI